MPGPPPVLHHQAAVQVAGPHHHLPLRRPHSHQLRQREACCSGGGADLGRTTTPRWVRPAAPSPLLLPFQTEVDLLGVNGVLYKGRVNSHAAERIFALQREFSGAGQAGGQPTCPGSVLGSLRGSRVVLSPPPLHGEPVRGVCACVYMQFYPEAAQGCDRQLSGVCAETHRRGAGASGGSGETCAPGSPSLVPPSAHARLRVFLLPPAQPQRLAGHRRHCAWRGPAPPPPLRAMCHPTQVSSSHPALGRHLVCPQRPVGGGCCERQGTGLGLIRRGSLPCSAPALGPSQPGSNGGPCQAPTHLSSRSFLRPANWAGTDWQLPATGGSSSRRGGEPGPNSGPEPSCRPAPGGRRAGRPLSPCSPQAQLQPPTWLPLLLEPAPGRPGQAVAQGCPTEGPRPP